MRPIKLSIDGLNSFETKQVLDFSELAGGVFGIFGKTGSGKSTISFQLEQKLAYPVLHLDMGSMQARNVDEFNEFLDKETIWYFDIFASGNKIYTVMKEANELENMITRFVISVNIIAEIGLSVRADTNIPTAINAAPNNKMPINA